jgi:hypothetical protein
MERNGIPHRSRGQEVTPQADRSVGFGRACEAGNAGASLKIGTDFF